MNKRFKEIRLKNEMSQEKFGEKIGIESRAHISALENGARNITDRIIKDVCREFSVNEKWLRTGEGDMYQRKHDETAAIVSELLDENNPFYDLILSITKTYQKLDPKSQTALKSLSKELLDNLRKEG